MRGIEPRDHAWKACMLPLHHTRYRSHLLESNQRPVDNHNKTITVQRSAN